MRYAPKWTKEQGLDILRARAEQLGRVPLSKEMRNPQSQWYVANFGSWNKAVVAAGLTPRPHGGKRRSKARDRRRKALAAKKPTLLQTIRRLEAITEAKKRYWQGAA